MNSIFTILKKAKNLAISAIVEDALKEMSSPHVHFSDTWVDQSVGFGCHFFHTTYVSKNDVMPYVDEGSSCIIVADSRIDYRNELAENLEIGLEDLEYLHDSRLILMSYKKWGENCVEYLYGDFAFAIFDQKRDLVFCARDHFGCRPLYYIDHQDYFVLSSDPKAFKSLPEFKYLIEDQYILDAICSIIPSKNYSAFTGICRLPPANTLWISPGNPVRIKRYWDLKIQNEFTSISEIQAIQGLKERFIEAVRQRSRSLDSIGIELSGGLDSSGIAVCLKNVLEEDIPVYAFSHALANEQIIRPNRYNSELEFSSKIVELSHIDRHYKITGENASGGYNAVVNYLYLTQKAIGQGYAVMTDLLYEEVSESGARVLMSGFGGDEGVTYQGDGLIEELAIKREFRKLLEVLKGRIKKNGGRLYLQFVKQYCLLAAPWLLRVIKKDWRRSRFKVFALSSELNAKYRMRKRYFDKVNIPYDPDVRKRQYKRLMHPHISDRMENSSLSAKVNGIEYRYPFFDVRLVEFFYSLPSEYKYNNGTGRYLFRKAMEGILTDEIRLRDDKTGATIPNVMYRIVKDETIFREIIEEGRANNRYHYVNYDKLHWMIDQFKSEENRKIMNFGPKAFLSPVSVLVLQKWQREGKIEIRIKC